MTHIVMILSNGFAPDMRVLREMEYLSQQGFQISLIAWDRRKALQGYEKYKRIPIYRIHTVPSDYATGWKQLFRIGKFWKEAVTMAPELNPDCIHCHDLDTLYAGYRIKKRTGCKLVFDAHEHYPAQMTLYLPRLFYFVLMTWQKWLMGATDGVITASSILCEEFQKVTDKPVITIGNYPFPEPFDQVDEQSIVKIRRHLGLDADRLGVAYIGGFTLNRDLESFIKSAGLLPQVHYHLWGDGPQRGVVENLCRNYKNVFYHGWLSPELIPLYFKSMDIIYYGLKVDYPGAMYNAPNTLTQAMAAGRPIIANNVGDLGKIIRETGCGLIPDPLTPTAIAGAISRLHDVKLREELGSNGLESVRNYYNAKTAGLKLVEFYQNLL